MNDMEPQIRQWYGQIQHELHLARVRVNAAIDAQELAEAQCQALSVVSQGLSRLLDLLQDVSSLPFGTPVERDEVFGCEPRYGRGGATPSGSIPREYGEDDAASRPLAP